MSQAKQWQRPLRQPRLHPGERLIATIQTPLLITAMYRVGRREIKKTATVPVLITDQRILQLCRIGQRQTRRDYYMSKVRITPVEDGEVSLPLADVRTMTLRGRSLHVEPWGHPSLCYQIPQAEDVPKVADLIARLERGEAGTPIEARAEKEAAHQARLAEIRRLSGQARLAGLKVAVTGALTSGAAVITGLLLLAAVLNVLGLRGSLKDMVTHAIFNIVLPLGLAGIGALITAALGALASRLYGRWDVQRAPTPSLEGL